MEDVVWLSLLGKGARREVPICFLCFILVYICSDEWMYDLYYLLLSKITFTFGQVTSKVSYTEILGEDHCNKTNSRKQENGRVDNPSHPPRKDTCMHISFVRGIKERNAVNLITTDHNLMKPKNLESIMKTVEIQLYIHYCDQRNSLWLFFVPLDVN